MPFIPINISPGADMPSRLPKFRRFNGDIQSKELVLPEVPSHISKHTPIFEPENEDEEDIAKRKEVKNYRKTIK